MSLMYKNPVELSTIRKFYEDNKHKKNYEIRDLLLQMQPEVMYQYIDEHYQDLIHEWRLALSESEQNFKSQTHLKKFLQYCDEAGWIKNIDIDKILADYAKVK